MDYDEGAAQAASLFLVLMFLVSPSVIEGHHQAQLRRFPRPHRGFIFILGSATQMPGTQTFVLAPDPGFRLLR